MNDCDPEEGKTWTTDTNLGDNKGALFGGTFILQFFLGELES